MLKGVGRQSSARTPLGELTMLPNSLVGWGGDTPSLNPTSLGASILAPAAFFFQPEPYHFLKRSGAHVLMYIYSI